MKKTKTTNLVKIESGRYSFFEGKNRVISVEHMPKEYLENYRINPKQIEIDANQPIEQSEKEIEMVSVPVDVLNGLLESEQFLQNQVLKGMTQEQWLQVNYEVEPA
jgi:hypothetical protein